MSAGIKTIDNLKKGGAMVKEGLEQDAYDLGSKVKDKVNEGQEYAKNGLHALEEEVKANPILSLGISFLVGMVASKLFSSK